MFIVVNNSSLELDGSHSCLHVNGLKPLNCKLKKKSVLISKAVVIISIVIIPEIDFTKTSCRSKGLKSLFSTITQNFIFHILSNELYAC